MDRPKIDKFLSELFEQSDDELRVSIKQLISALAGYRNAYHKRVPTHVRNEVYDALYPYDEDRDMQIVCPHCRKNTYLEASTSLESTADGWWSVVKTDDRFFLDWHDDFDVDVQGIEFRCQECGSLLTCDLDSLKEMYDEQRKSSTNEELGILGS